MAKRIAAGAGGGVITGLILAVVMRGLPVSAADSTRTNMITFAARLIHAASPPAGWLAYLAYGVALGALFGAFLTGGRVSVPRTAILGGMWGADVPRHRPRSASRRTRRRVPAVPQHVRRHHEVLEEPEAREGENDPM